MAGIGSDNLSMTQLITLLQFLNARVGTENILSMSVDAQSCLKDFEDKFNSLTISSFKALLFGDPTKNIQSHSWFHVHTVFSFNDVINQIKTNGWRFKLDPDVDILSLSILLSLLFHACSRYERFGFNSKSYILIGNIIFSIYLNPTDKQPYNCVVESFHKSNPQNGKFIKYESDFPQDKIYKQFFTAMEIARRNNTSDKFFGILDCFTIVVLLLSSSDEFTKYMEIFSGGSNERVATFQKHSRRIITDISNYQQEIARLNQLLDQFIQTNNPK